MPAERNPLALHAGQIVLADWRGDALPKEPNKLRPAVVVEDDGLFAPSYPNAILVPLTEDANFAIRELSVPSSRRRRMVAANPAGQPRTWWRRRRNRDYGRRNPTLLRVSWLGSGGRLP